MGIAAMAVALGLAACGGKEQDADSPGGTFRVEIASASFPAKQRLAQTATMKVTVRNADTKAVPSVAVTVATQPGKSGGAAQPFGSDIADPAVADAARPIWVVDQPPKGGDTAVTNTWTLGRLPAGQSRTFTWKVTPVKAGKYTIDYSVTPDLTGKAKAAAGKTKGSFAVDVSDVPPSAKVGDDGEVVETPSN
jgi:hypothetical protein